MYWAGKVILGLTILLDGFAEDCNGNVGALFSDLEVLDDTNVLRESQRNTGAVLSLRFKARGQLTT